jgi:hypothetical protein
MKIPGLFGIDHAENKRFYPCIPENERSCQMQRRYCRKYQRNGGKSGNFLFMPKGLIPTVNNLIKTRRGEAPLAPALRASAIPTRQ